MKTSDLNIVVFGAGAIGATLAAWLYKVHDNIHILARNQTLDALRQNGLTVFQNGEKPHTSHLNVIENLNDLPAVDVIILCVKNYSLEMAARQIREQVGGEPLIIAIQNGLENQNILPRYFPKIIYGIAQHNAWKEGPTTFGYNRQKTLILDNPVFDDVRKDIVHSLFKKAMPTVVTDRYNDAAHNKLFANITNSLLSLGGKPQTGEDLRALHYLFAKIAGETIHILEAAGIKQFPLEGIPSWKLIKLMARLPLFLSRRRFSKGLSEVEVTSMQQDVMNNAGYSELDSINGYLLKLAEQNNVSAPYSHMLYDICREEFRKSPYSPLAHNKVLRLIKSRLDEGS